MKKLNYYQRNKERLKQKSIEYYWENKEEILKKNKQYYKENKEKFKLKNRKGTLKQYNLTLDEYDDLFTSQQGKCAICSIYFIDEVGHVDHDHETGKVRGLLCMSCNTKLGIYEKYKDKFERYLNECSS